MSKSKHGRYIPAFILLFLFQEPSYGSRLLNTMEEKMPRSRADSAAVYRSLQDLEDAGAVDSYWDTTEPGPARKWYKITDRGLDKLTEFKLDIEASKKNLEFFLNYYEKLNDRG